MGNSVLSDVTPAQLDVLLSVGGDRADDPWTPRSEITTRYQLRRGTMANPNEYIRVLTKHGYLDSRDAGEEYEHRLSETGRESLRALHRDIDGALEGDTDD